MIQFEILTSRVFSFVLPMALALGVSAASAQTSGYPDRPVRLVVPYAPGGVTDIQGRVIAHHLTKEMGQNFIIENRGGAGGRIGADSVAKARPDGYTLLLGTPGPLTVLPALAPNMPYDAEQDFVTLGHVANMPNIMVVHPSSKFTSLQALIDFAKSNPGGVRFGSAGVGSSGHMAGELLGTLAGVKMTHVPYKGSGPGLIDLVGGNIDVMFDGLPSALPHIKSERLRGVVVLSEKRSPVAPQFPSTTEAGMPKFVYGSGTGLLAPKGTPQPIVAALEKTLKKIADDPEFAKSIASQGASIDYMDAAQYRQFLREETERARTLGKRAGVVLQ